ncbi:MAG: hypothetical protein A2010_16475 [Nitrospirae bacterium GWD2_57_9]|nr:MAG: hypothetical protein A2010_16475 [Nitrospirae bacterium GWD2_57_9]
MARYGKQSQKSVGQAMEKMKEGKLRSGGSGKKVRNPKQAIAIGLSEARKKGAKVPPAPSSRRKSSTGARKRKSTPASIK